MDYYFSRHEIINVNMSDKPEWFLERNPLGKVPVLEIGPDNKILYESLIVAEYLDEVYPNLRPLQPKDAFQRASDKVFIETFGNSYSGLYAIYRTENLADVWTDITETLKKVDKLLAKRRGNEKFLSGRPSQTYISLKNIT